MRPPHQRQRRLDTPRRCPCLWRRLASRREGPDRHVRRLWELDCWAVDSSTWAWRSRCVRCGSAWRDAVAVVAVALARPSSVPPSSSTARGHATISARLDRSPAVAPECSPLRRQRRTSPGYRRQVAHRFDPSSTGCPPVAPHCSRRPFGHAQTHRRRGSRRLTLTTVDDAEPVPEWFSAATTTRPPGCAQPQSKSTTADYRTRGTQHFADYLALLRNVPAGNVLSNHPIGRGQR
jgi:hypothetical protein